MRKIQFDKLNVHLFFIRVSCNYMVFKTLSKINNSFQDHVDL